MSVTFYRMIRFKKFQFVLNTQTKELCLKYQSLPTLIVFSKKRDSQATFLFFLFLPKNQKDSSSLRQHFMVATFYLKQFFTLQNMGFITVELTYFPSTLFRQRISTTVLISAVVKSKLKCCSLPKLAPSSQKQIYFKNDGYNQNMSFYLFSVVK